MPIYGLDTDNNTTSIKDKVNSSQYDSVNGNHYHLHDQAVDLENSTSGKYNDIQDLRLKILEILEGLRLARDENVTERRAEITQLENELNILKKQMHGLS